MDSLKTTLRGAGQRVGLIDEEKTIEDELCEICPKLTMQQRIAGFCACCGFGYLLSVFATLTLVNGFSEENVRLFAILYILGNLIAILATMFFVGPRRMCKRMWHKTRRIGTGVWLFLMISVFVCALVLQYIEVILVLIVLETMAGIWYSASYIPWGRRMIISCCQASVFSPCPEACAPCAKQVA